MIYFFFILILFPLALLFLALIGTCLVYLYLGVRLSIEGRREGSRIKIRSGLITFINAFIGVVVICALAYTCLYLLLASASFG